MTIKYAAYSFTISELSDFISESLEKRLGYAPKVDAEYDTESCVPISLHFTDDDSDEFDDFRDTLNKELFHFETEYEDEFGHNLLHYLFGKPIHSYVFDKNETKYLEYVKDDMAPVYILVDETSELNYRSAEEIKDLIEEYDKENEQLAPNVTNVPFLVLENSDISLIYFSNYTDSLSVHFSYKDNAPIEFSVNLSSMRKGEVTLTNRGYCISEEMRKEINRLQKEMTEVLKNELSFVGNLTIHLKDETMDIFEDITFYEGLTNLESVIFSLSRQGKNYQEIADILSKHKKAVDNTLQRVKGKVLEHVMGHRKSPLDERIISYYATRSY